jgi:acyl-CoA thioester hydrolase
MLTAKIEDSTLNNSYRIYYEDTDSGGVVYYANYLKFFERGRTEFLRAKNILQSDLAKNFGIIFVVKNCFIKYLKPAKLDDLILIATTIDQIKPASIKIKQQMTKDGQILCCLDVEIVCVDAVSFKPKKISKIIKLT